MTPNRLDEEEPLRSAMGSPLCQRRSAPPGVRTVHSGPPVNHPTAPVCRCATLTQVMCLSPASIGPNPPPTSIKNRQCHQIMASLSLSLYIQIIVTEFQQIILRMVQGDV